MPPMPFTAVGLLYRYGYFTQKLSAMGDQEAEYEAQDFMKIAVTPVRDKENIPPFAFFKASPSNNCASSSVHPNNLSALKSETLLI